MKYPKLWNGTSPLGEALVRSLQRVRSPFLSAKAGDVHANKMGGRSEVFQGDEQELFSSGTVVRTKEGVEVVADLMRGLKLKDVVATPARRIVGWHVGRNRFLQSATWNIQQSDVNGLRLFEMGALLRFRKGRGSSPYVDATAQGVVAVPTGWATEHPGFGLDFFGFDHDGGSRGAFMFTWPHSTARDPLNNPVVRPAIRIVNFDTEAAEVEAFLPRESSTAQSQFIVPAFTSVTPRRKVALVASYAFTRVEPTVAVDAQAFMYVSDDEGQSWTIVEVLSLFADKLADNATARVGEDARYAEPINHSIRGLADADWLVFTPQHFVALVVIFTGNSARWVPDWLHLALRTTDAGDTWTAHVMPPIPGLPDAPAVVQPNSCVVLGGLRAIAKRRPFGRGSVAGMTPNASFVRTEDGGISWSVISPTGLPSLQVHDLGEFTVTRPYVNAADQGEILITAWDEGRKAYTIYRSVDSGDSWLFKASLGKSNRREGRLDEIGSVQDNEALPVSFNGVRWVGPAKRPRPASEVAPWRYDAEREA